MLKQLRYLKSIVIIGFITLISLCVVGTVLIYRQMVGFSEVGNTDYPERKELVVVSNTLAALYKAEGAGSLLLGQTLPEARTEYDLLMGQVYAQIDTLRAISSDQEMNVSLDSVVVLLNKKQKNRFKMFQLLDSANKQLAIPVVKKTVLSKKKWDNQDRLTANQIQESSDTVVIFNQEKKNLFQRIKSVFNTTDKDSSVTIFSNSQTIDSIYALTFLDSIIGHIDEVAWAKNKETKIFAHQLVIRQSAMHIMNEELTTQINKILRDIECREYQAALNLLNEKEVILNRSAKIAYITGIIALFIALVFLILILRILTYSQRYRQELEYAKKYAEDLLGARERLIFTITHDIKAPISSIIGYMELLYNSKLQERDKYYIENMQGSAEHILDLVKNLLDYHTLESGKQKINKMPFIPNTLLRDICQSFIPQANRGNITLGIHCDGEIDQSYESDPYRIRQIVGNLLSNAIKFTPTKGKVELFASIQTYSNGKGDILKVSVKDSGRGIATKYQKSIFDAFERIEPGRIEGSGLGLAITKRLVLLLDGTIELNSESGKGSEFIIQIPVKKSDIKDSVVLEKEEKKSVKVLDTSKKILFIDDDIVQLNIFSEVLKRKGFTPTICQNSIEALELIQQISFDMIFTDIQMPDMNGFQLVERIRLATIPGAKTIPVFALSASSDISEQKFVEAGFTGFLSKPFSVDMLMEVITLYLGGDDTCMPIRNHPELKGFDSLVNFAYDDKNAAREIIISFIDENRKNIKNLKEAIDKDDWDTVKKISHKMLPLMRMISEVEIVHILCEFEKGIKNKEKGEDLISKVGALLTKATYYCSGL